MRPGAVIPLSTAAENRREGLIEYAVLAALGTLILLLALFGTGSSRSGSSRSGSSAQTEVKEAEAFRHCPLCGSAMQRKEKVHSVLYPGGQDRMMDIHGCPHCYPPSPSVRRRCPVCSRELGNEEVVIARFFQVEQRRHVHVLGCSSCYRRRSG